MKKTPVRLGTDLSPPAQDDGLSDDLGKEFLPWARLSPGQIQLSGETV